MGAICNCADELAGHDGKACDKVDYGNQIVFLAFQKLDGAAPFDGTTTNIDDVADWQTALAAVGDDKVIILNNVAATKPSQDPTIEEGQEVPYGVQEVIENTLMIEGHVRYLTEAAFTALETLTNCTGNLRLWYGTNRGWLFGSNVQADATTGQGFESASFVSKDLDIAGIGTQNKIPFTVKGVEFCMPKPIVQVNFLRTLENA